MMVSNFISDSTILSANSDLCESCGDGGKLLCCDNCPRSFHFECINPPMTPEEVNTMKGDWYCTLCHFRLVSDLDQHSTPFYKAPIMRFVLHAIILRGDLYNTLEIPFKRRSKVFI
jgi:hypothetical protein